MLYNLFDFFSYGSNGLNHMNKFKLILPAALACALLLSAPARAAEDASHFQLSQAMIEKLKAAETDMKLLHKSDAAAPEVNPDQSIDAAIRKIDQDVSTTAVLAKHGLTGRDLVLSAHALLHAGTFISMEQTLGRQKGADLYQGYTKEQQANIDLVRGILGGNR